MTKLLRRTADRLRDYWALTKSLQTGLLVITGLAGYSSGKCPVLNPNTIAMLAGSLFLAVSGSTVLNMWYDADIDLLMDRTCLRPLPAKRVQQKEVLSLGILMTLAGIIWAFIMAPGYGLIVTLGTMFNVAVYTRWLKRRTPWSILWGGFAGGTPVLAGRVLAVGHVDAIGLLLALAIVLWIPTHILTFNLRYEEDYRKAAIPTFPSIYGRRTTRFIIALSSVGATIAVTAASFVVGLTWGYLGVLGSLGVGLFILAVISIVKPSDRMNFNLFKYASLFMLLSMGILFVGAL